MPDLDILALAAHRDDIEQTCGGTLLKAAAMGQRTGILDLTQGEMGTRGDAASRARESDVAGKILRVSFRKALDLPDGRVENTFANRIKIARVLREQRPRVLILPYWQGRHPDHYTASILGYEATFLAGLTKLGSTPATADILTAEGMLKLAPHRPFKIVYASLYYDVRPSFVVDITAQFDEKVRSLLAYESQYSDQSSGTGLFPAHAEIRQRLETMARFYGLLAGVDYAEPYVQKEIGLVEDLTLVPVKSL
jgi:bacillithiol biosynthesis deacetylase BshB1